MSFWTVACQTHICVLLKALIHRQVFSPHVDVKHCLLILFVISSISGVIFVAGVREKKWKHSSNFARSTIKTCCTEVKKKLSWISLQCNSLKKNYSWHVVSFNDICSELRVHNFWKCRVYYWADCVLRLQRSQPHCIVASRCASLVLYLTFRGMCSCEPLLLCVMVTH